jgi:hypothetical protein
MRDLTARKGACANITVQNNILAADSGQINLSWDGPSTGTSSNHNVLYPAHAEFVFNAYGSRSFSDILAEIHASWVAAGGTSAAISYWPSQESKQGYWVTNNQWKAMKSWDTSSVIAQAMNVSLERRSWSLSLDIDTSPAQAGCRPVAGVDFDYAGNSMPASSPKAGPFQNIDAGVNAVSVWDKEKISSNTIRRALERNKGSLPCVCVKRKKRCIIVRFFGGLYPDNIGVYTACGKSAGARVNVAAACAAIDCSAFSRGLYLVRIKAGARIFAEKIALMR